MKNIGVVHQNFLPIGMLGASTDKPYKLDVDKAKALLAKAGLPNGFKVTMDTRSVQPITAMAEAMQQTLKRGGIELEILPGDGKQTLTKYRARTHDIYIGTWGADYWDPHTNADTFARNPDNGDDAKSKPLAWRNAWAIPELTKKADAAVLERDGAKRKAMYEEIQAEFRKTSPFVMLFQQTEVAAYRSNVEGLRIGPTSDRPTCSRSRRKFRAVTSSPRRPSCRRWAAPGGSRQWPAAPASTPSGGSPAGWPRPPARGTPWAC
jgi:peptide/nickel transport system substrate-binding protein